MLAAVAVFAKVPHPGRVKTRLSPSLSAADAAGFHRACVLDTWSEVQNLPGIAAFLYADAGSLEFTALAGSRVRSQRGADLGERMLHCFQELEAAGFERLVIVGSDSPTLPPEYVIQAVESLETHDAVIGPSDDGGYYAIGCRKPHTGMFDQVAWSSAGTLSGTERNLEALGLRLHRLPPWYDIDTIADLRRLAAEPDLTPHVSRWIAEHASRFT